VALAGNGLLAGLVGVPCWLGITKAYIGNADCWMSMCLMYVHMYEAWIAHA
jgi:hypothetical protein